MVNNGNVDEKRKQCWSKQGELEHKIENLKKQLLNVGSVSDLDLIKHFLAEKFDFDIEKERTKVTNEVEKLKQEIHKLQSEVKQFRECYEQHYTSGKMIGAPGQAEKNKTICEKCKFQPFYAETAAQEEAIARKEQERAKLEKEAAEQKKARLANLKQ